MDSTVKWTASDSANATGTMRQSECEVKFVEGEVVALPS